MCTGLGGGLETGVVAPSLDHSAVVSRRLDGFGLWCRGWAVSSNMARLITSVTAVCLTRGTAPGGWRPSLRLSWWRLNLTDLFSILLFLIVVGRPDVWLQRGNLLLSRPCREHCLSPFSFTKSLTEKLGHGKADMLAQPLWCEPPQERMEGQLLLGSRVKLWVTALSMQLHICSEGTQALSFLAVTAG